MNKKLPKATHQGEINIGKITIPCAVLEDGTRVLNRIEFLRALGRTGKAKGGREYDKEFKVPVFLSAKNLNPFINNDLLENSKPIIFKDSKGIKSIGYKAELLPSVCNVFLEANDKKALSAMQTHILERCKILIRGLATIGIIALVDEATGYQEFRARRALEKILDKYIAKELRKWAKTFPDEFYEYLFQLKGWQYIPFTVKRPSVVGKMTNDLIYSRLEYGVLEELKQLNPKDKKGYRKHRHHQWLTEDIGHPRLREHIASVIALMKASTNWNNFYRLINRALPKKDDTLELLLETKDGKPI